MNSSSRTNQRSAGESRQFQLDASNEQHASSHFGQKIICPVPRLPAGDSSVVLTISLQYEEIACADRNVETAGG